MVVDRVGYGAGRKDPPQVANLVRVLVGTIDAQPVDAVELACNLDDVTGQQASDAIAGLLAAGALDAWAAPITMKKGRPGLVLGALVRPSDADALADWVLRHTPALGVRRHPVTRRVLDRWHETVSTDYGVARVKVGGRDGVAVHATPEHDDVAALAAAAGVAVLEVSRAVMASWKPKKPAPP